MKFGFKEIAAVLAALLALSTVLLAMGQEDTDAYPSITSSRPSGLGAFAELLRRDGHQVVLERSMRPRTDPNNLLVVLEVSLFWDDVEGVESGRDWSGGEDETWDEDYDALERLDGILRDHVEAGGPMLVVKMPGNFRQHTTAAKEGRVVHGPKPPGKERRVSWTSTEMNDPVWIERGIVYPLYRDSTAHFMSLMRAPGTVLIAADGIGLANRFLGDHDNADVFLEAVRRLVKPGGRIVFVESYFGNVSEKGLLASVGPWAAAAWKQMIVLALVVAITLGLRFGRAESQTLRQRGSRELVDAVSEVMRRSGKHAAALDVLLTDALMRVRAACGLPPGTPERTVMGLVSPELGAAIAQVKDLTAARKTTSAERVHAAANLLAAVQGFEDGRKRHRQ